VENNQIEFEPGIETKIKISFAVFFVVIISIIFIYDYFYGEDDQKKHLLYIENYSKVIEINIDKENHNSLYIKCSDGRRAPFHFDYKVGDSISKRKGDSIEYIFRDGKILENNLFKIFQK
jgi:hypothetical protein